MNPTAIPGSSSLTLIQHFLDLTRHSIIVRPLTQSITHATHFHDLPFTHAHAFPRKTRFTLFSSCSVPDRGTAVSPMRSIPTHALISFFS